LDVLSVSLAVAYSSTPHHSQLQHLLQAAPAEQLAWRCQLTIELPVAGGVHLDTAHIKQQVLTMTRCAARHMTLLELSN
jgi:hypothetical protein